MASADRLFFAYLDEMKLVTILLPLSYHHGMSSTFSIAVDYQSKPLAIRERLQVQDMMKYICRQEEEIPFGKTCWIFDEYGNKTELQIGAVIRTEEFDEQFFYDGRDLGVVYRDGQTQFKLWAPTAVQVKLKLHHPNDSFSEIVKMRREERGVWSAVIPQDLEYFQYLFLVQVNQEWHEAVDPYAVAVTAGGDRGVVVNLERTKTAKQALPPLENPVDAIIYETHIRDFTIHPNSGAKYKGLYLGAGEQGTMGADGELTGLSYVKDLGITHIEFLPFHEFEGVDEPGQNHTYNWGYNPLHFNVPNGSYSTKPDDPYSRIRELKQLIDSIHQAGLRVIMDGVYNHVYHWETSSFEKIVPGYYFRHNEFGFPSNGTGVGNDIASERKMVRKFITDSVRFWFEEYHIDGIRFDLMGILDIETMNEIRKTADSFSQDILLIGEGWNLNTPLPQEKKAIIRNQEKIPRIGLFNDRFRDSIKGSTFNLFDKGFVLGNAHYFEAACEALSGSIGFKKREDGLFQAPSQSVNYVECHDNHTLWDKQLSCQKDEEETLRMKCHRLATAMVILSQGIPFLHSGQEFFRTKYGDGNSYRSPDSINQLDWDRKSMYVENVRYIKGLIQLRKWLPCFRMRTAAQIRSSMCLLPAKAPVISYLYKNPHHDYQNVILIINPLPDSQSVFIPEGEWRILADGEEVKMIPKKFLNGGEITIHPVSLLILSKK